MFCSNSGVVELAFQRRGGRTALAHSHVVAPLAVIRPFRLEDGGLAVQLITLGPGLCAGDRLRIDVRAAEGTRVVVTTTAASRIMSMDDGGVAEQDVRLTAAAGATLEYYPAINIPFPRSAFRQTVRVSAARTSRVGVLEAWALGRTARDEYLQFTRIDSVTTLEVDGCVMHAEAMDLEPAAADLTSNGILERRRYLASGVWHGLQLGPGSPFAGADAVFAQSRADIAYLRALADSAPALEDVMARSIERVAAEWNLSPSPLRRLRC